VLVPVSWFGPTCLPCLWLSRRISVACMTVFANSITIMTGSWANYSLIQLFYFATKPYVWGGTIIHCRVSIIVFLTPQICRYLSPSGWYGGVSNLSMATHAILKGESRVDRIFPLFDKRHVNRTSKQVNQQKLYSQVPWAAQRIGAAFPSRLSRRRTQPGLAKRSVSRLLWTEDWPENTTGSSLRQR
jgi:hypothetical protein